MSCKSCLNCVPPIFIILLVGFTYYSYVVEFCINFLTSLLKKGIYLVFYNLFQLMFIWAYTKTVLTQHAPIPDEYKLTKQEQEKLLTFPEEQIDLILRKLINIRKLEIYTCSDKGKIRYCRKCILIKPDRSHHCSTCNKCVLKMDHHCPWVYNCVGYSNYKQFVLMLFYALLLCFFHVGTIVEYFIVLWKDVQNSWNKMLIGIGLSLAAITSLLVATLLFYHLGLLCRNETTLEALRDIVFMNDNFTFDLGNRQNFLQVFGDNACYWLLPIHSTHENGYEFPIRNLYS